MTDLKNKMPETWYRASRCCRVLGNPVAYLILKSLGDGRKTPSELAEEIGPSLTQVSNILRHLRETDLVRYETRHKEKVYWVKDGQVLDALARLEQFVDTMRAAKE
ncbi:MAG: winged helix-turn-helix transcriptional regulator [Planctomycetes bacterium]|nr:winged helix-turn-helix transcriptional regulator [Planctomycetota bacterium]